LTIYIYIYIQFNSYTCSMYMQFIYVFNVFQFVYVFNVFQFIYVFNVFQFVYVFNVFQFIYVFNVFQFIYVFNVFQFLYVFNVYAIHIRVKRTDDSALRKTALAPVLPQSCNIKLQHAIKQMEFSHCLVIYYNTCLLPEEESSSCRNVVYKVVQI
jgi:hypothetical protein